jgi:hypothetical protein
VRPGTAQRLDPARGRRGPRLQARRQAGLRQRARHLADAVPGGARQGGAGRAAFHAGPRRAQGDGGRRPARGRAAGPDPAPGLQDGRPGRGGAPDARGAEGATFDVADSRPAPLVAGRSVPLRGRRALRARGSPRTPCAPTSACARSRS